MDDGAPGDMLGSSNDDEVWGMSEGGLCRVQYTVGQVGTGRRTR
jgi:hypothetical protein